MYVEEGGRVWRWNLRCCRWDAICTQRTQSGAVGKLTSLRICAKLSLCFPQVRDKDVVQSVNEEHRNCRYLPEYKLHDNITATDDAKMALDGAQFILHAVPVQASPVSSFTVMIHCLTASVNCRNFSRL